MKGALFIVFHWPPFSGSSGVHRSLRFTKYLPEQGWTPLVLSASPRAFPTRGDDLLGEITPGTVVRRAFALDAARHLAVRGRYLRATALPDRWVSWWLPAVATGLQMIRRHRPAVIYATYPIATAHLIGITLARLSGLPLVADYRDAMVTADMPADPAVRRAYQRIEQRVMAGAGAAIFTTPRSLELYRQRYPALPPGKMHCIRNGYDEGDFSAFPADSARPPGRRLRLLHSGLLRLDERDPRPFLAALGDCLGDGRLRRDEVEVVFRATGDDEGHRRLVAEAGLGDVVRIEPPLPYAAALREMADADVLLVFQDRFCNHLVPAKLYEYIRTGRPVLALTDRLGETAELVEESAAGRVLDLASREEIAAALPGFLADVRRGTAPHATLAQAERYSRRAQTAELAAVFARLAGTMG
ncbi:MAG: glycosyltransferase [Gammaproteobacteria bacterium]|nr:glycosyltransferase [Gammaproteobacteria bacterium]